MVDTKRLYLPLSRETITAILDEQLAISDHLRALSSSELSALYVLQKLPDLHAKGLSTLEIERRLAKLIAELNTEAKNDGSNEFSDEIERLIDLAPLRAGFAAMLDLGVDLLEQDEVKSRNYLQPNGEWNFNFARNRQTNLVPIEDPHYQIPGLPQNTGLTDQQFRIPYFVNPQIDEDLHIQGYAGTGKSHLIKVITSLLLSQDIKPHNILLLARTWQQLKPLKQKVTNSITCLRYEDLMQQTIPKGPLDKAYARIRSKINRNEHLDPADIVSFFGLTGIGRTSAYSIARASKGTLFLYCESADEFTLADHIPQWFKWNELIRQKSIVDAAALETIVIRTAESLWQETVSPTTSDFKPPIRGFHKIKFAALHGFAIPKHYTHVIIDECHDASQALLQVIDNSQVINNSMVACITLADDYQKIAGSSVYRGEGVRKTSITQSCRAGHQLEAIINPIIITHPVIKPKELFVGSNDIKTTVTFYPDQKPTIPEQVAAILVSDYWALWAWADHLLKKRVQFHLYTDDKSLNRFVQDCIELKAHGTHPRHGELFRFKTWDRLVEAMTENRGFKRVYALLEQGYSTKNWETTQRWIRTSPPDKYALSTLTAAKNREFDVVMLGPDTTDMILKTDRANKDTARKAMAALYIGATRVRQKLIAPESLRNWIEESSSP